MNFEAYHGVTAAQHQANFNNLSKQGYRMISLSVYGDASSPVIRSGLGSAWRSRMGSRARYQCRGISNFLQHLDGQGVRSRPGLGHRPILECRLRGGL